MGKFISFLFCFAAAAQDARTVLDAQTAAWNRGDLEAFVETYEDSPSITFLGKVLTHGRDGVLARYKRSYDTPEKMGKLRFEVIEVRPLGNEHALLIGKFFLTRTEAGGGDVSGMFTLILYKGSRGWKIVHDHTS
ncbi:MAG: SgcJ/EcaC family oxidoreductase [Acidobacteria bacterium]|nr:SgcJ/EcaC family oxidoreductase [Acidobacteriota bacterium]